MFTRRFCPNCLRLFQYPSLVSSQPRPRWVSSKNETIAVEETTDTVGAEAEDLDRNVSRLPDDVYRDFKGLPPTEIKEQFHTRAKLRSLWGKYGRKTGIDPKLCWPTQAEMDEIIDDERVYNMELSEKIKIIKERRETKQKEFDQIQAKVAKNLKAMPKMMDDYRKRAIERERAQTAQIKVKNDLAEQARDFYGFSVDPDDERMQFMLLQLEEAQKEEDKKARKAAKKLEAHQQLQKLMGMGGGATGDAAATAAAAESEAKIDPLTPIPEAKEQDTDMKLFAKLVTERSKLAKQASRIADEQAAAQAKGQKKK